MNAFCFYFLGLNDTTKSKIDAKGKNENLLYF